MNGNFCAVSHEHYAKENAIYEPPRDKTNNVAVRPAKTQISLGIRPVWSESSLCAQWVAKGPSFLHADSEDSDQTGRMPRLIWVFAGRTLTLLILSRGGSYYGDLCQRMCDAERELKSPKGLRKCHKFKLSTDYAKYIECNYLYRLILSL